MMAQYIELKGGKKLQSEIDQSQTLTLNVLLRLDAEGKLKSKNI